MEYAECFMDIFFLAASEVTIEILVLDHVYQLSDIRVMYYNNDCSVSQKL